MKKRFLLLSILTILTSCLFAQSKALYINETFDGADFPPGWEKLPWSINPSQNVISISNSNSAGGDPRELCFTHVGGNTAGRWGRVLSPEIDFSNTSGVFYLEFLFKLEPFGDLPSVIGVGTTTDDGETWNTIWQENYTGTVISAVAEEVESPDFFDDNVRLVFYFKTDDDFPLAFRYYVDNIRLYTLVEYDASLLSINGIDEAMPQGKKEIGFNFSNKGSKTITSLEASYQFGDLPKITQVFESLSVVQDDEFSLTFAEKTQLELDNDFVLTVSIDKINGQPDQAPADNYKNMDVHTYMAFAEKRLVIDHFTSSTCSPCLHVNQLMQEFLAEFQEQTVITKYPTHIPGTGDPYYSPDVAQRMSYYAFTSSIPTIYFNGNQLEINTFFDLFFKTYSSKQVPVVEMRGNFKVEATTVKIDFNIAAYQDIEDAVLYVSVNEKHTTGNTGNNGETDFYHVMMKMLPNGNGTPVNINRYGVQHFTFEYDMASTFVEEMNDLEVAVFIQDKTGKKIYNGNYLLERNLLENAPPTDLKLVIPTIKGEVFKAQWIAPANDKFTGYNVYVNDEKIASNITYNDDFFELPDGTYYDDINVVKVSAVYPDGVESVRIAEYKFRYEGSVNPLNETQVKIYPNPAESLITVSAEQNIKTVEIFNMLGQLQNVINLETNIHSINLEKYHSGIYFLKIKFEDGSNVNRKIVIR